MIKTFMQGQDTDKELWCSIGQWTVDKKVHETLGVAVTGETGDLWLVYYATAKPVGFAQVRVAKNGTSHIRYLFAGTEARQGELIKACIAAAREMKSAVIFTNDRDTATVWNAYGFKKTNNRPGSFVRWERELK